jgi:preprotein translocase SecE subunit
VGGRRAEREDPPVPIGHAAPDVELAEAQLALGRPELRPEEPEEPVELEELEDRDGAAEAEAPPLPVAREHRPGQVARVVNFAQGSWRELQRVQWPDRRQVMQATGVVIGFVIVAGVFLGVSDLVAQKLMDLILK